MPVGVPKVSYLINGEEEESWVELYHAVYRSRVLFIGQEITDEISNQICGMMVFLNIENQKKKIVLLLNSPGGSILPGMAIFDLMQTLPSPVHTICVGTAASMAALLLVGGESKQRTAFPHCRVMMHQPASSVFDGPSYECGVHANAIRQFRQNMIEIYQQRTGKPYSQIYEDIHRDFFMSAKAAQAYGIVDELSNEE
uniref:ATP-dependent Clp protease proteolytic subunit n=1 Tax=Hedysarum semenovii TaxID=1641295 RepID=A0A6H0E7X1_9FABA|nr:ClpP [Hedysarum semenovii]QIS98064.1 ClpP [Hedysarum semenovii]UWV18529.1 ClpP [Hedysarum semenovii]